MPKIDNLMIDNHCRILYLQKNLFQIVFHHKFPTGVKESGEELRGMPMLDWRDDLAILASNVIEKGFLLLGEVKTVV